MRCTHRGCESCQTEKPSGLLCYVEKPGIEPLVNFCCDSFINEGLRTGNIQIIVDWRQHKLLYIERFQVLKRIMINDWFKIRRKDFMSALRNSKDRLDLDFRIKALFAYDQLCHSLIK